MNINKEKYDFNDLVQIIAELRGEHGCPWDKSQTHETLKKYLIEESYEVINEIDEKNNGGICEELGDVLLQVVMHAQLAKEEKCFDIENVIDGISKKMIYRHPFVFENDKVENADQALDSFNARKKKEKGIGGIEDKMARIPESYPMLLKTYKLSSILSKNLELWDNEVNEKILNNISRIDNLDNEEEKEIMIGNILFEVCKIAQKNNINPELALEKTYRDIQKNVIEKMKS